MISNFQICMNAVIPLLLVMAVGFLARLAKLMDDSLVTKMNSAVFKLLLPFLVFDNIYRSDIHSAVNIPLITFTVVCTLLFAAAGVPISGALTSDNRKKSVIIQCMYRTNFALIGLPVARNIYGDGNIGCAAVLFAVIVPLFNVLAVIVLESYSGKKTSALKLAISVLKNPMIISSVIGFLFLFTGWKLPKAAETFVTDMRNASATILLFLLGASFRFEGLRRNIKLVCLLCTARLIFIPGLILAGGALLGFRDIAFVALLGAVASPLPTNTFTMTNEMGGDGELAGNVIVMSSVLCLVTVFGWCFLYKTLGVF